MSFLENLTTFKNNCCAGPVIPLTLTGCICGAIYLPLKYMPAAVIMTSDKVKFAAMILAGAYILVTSCAVIKHLLTEDIREHLNNTSTLKQFANTIRAVFVEVLRENLGLDGD